MKRKMVAFVATSSDPNYQDVIQKWIVKQKLGDSHVRVSIRGCVKDRETLLKQLRASYKDHHFAKMYLFNAEGDIAYAERKFASRDLEREAQRNDLRNTKAAINAELPKLQVALYYMTKSGAVEPVN